MAVIPWHGCMVHRQLAAALHRDGCVVGFRVQSAWTGVPDLLLTRVRALSPLNDPYPYPLSPRHSA
jgi:hypothetical protein